MSNKLFTIEQNGTITLKKETTIQNGSETYTIGNKLLMGNNIYLYMNENNFYMTSKPINRTRNNEIWIKDLGIIPVEKGQDKMIIHIEKYLLFLATKDKDGNYQYGFNSSEGSFHLYFQPGKFDICKPFRMEADGELFKFPKFLEEQNGELYYDSNTNLPYIISSSKNETTSKKGIKFDVQIFNDMLEKPLDEGEFLYLTAVREKTPSGLYKNYLLPVYRSKDNSRIKTVTQNR